MNLLVFGAPLEEHGSNAHAKGVDFNEELEFRGRMGQHNS